MLPVEKVQTPIAASDSATTERMQGMIAIKMNDAVETNLHVIPVFTNEKPTQPIDVTQLRLIDNLYLASPTFHVLGGMNFLLGADVLEESMSDNRMKDNGVVI